MFEFAGCLVGQDPCAAGCAEGVHLECLVLLQGRVAGIADQGVLEWFLIVIRVPPSELLFRDTGCGASQNRSIIGLSGLSPR